MLNDAKLSSSLLFRKHEFGCKEKNQGSGVPLPIFFSSLRVDMLGGKRLNKGMSQMYRVNKCHIL